MGELQLSIQHEDGSAQTLPLDDTPLTIGRVKGNTLILADKTLSRQHAKIFSRDGSYHLVDLNSSHGSFVNGKRVTRHALQVGDEIRLGSTILRFGSATSQSTGTPAPSPDSGFSLEMPDELLPAARSESRSPAADRESNAPLPGDDGASAQREVAVTGEDPFAEDEALEAARMARFGRPAKQAKGGGAGALYRAEGRKTESGPVWSHELDQYSPSTRWLAMLIVLVVVAGLGFGVMKLVQGVGSGDDEGASAATEHTLPPPPERRR